MDKLYEALIAPDLEQRIKQMKDRIRRGMILTGTEMGVTRYNYVVIGDCGTGKSSYLNTLETAYSEDNEYIEKYQTGNSDVNSTTIFIYSKPIAGCFIGTDLPGVNGNNYADPAKIHALLEGRIEQRVMLDGGDWANIENQKEFHPKNMVHMVLFVIAYDGLRKPTMRKRYRELKEKMTSYKKFGINGYHPFLIITKADTFDDDYSKDKIRIYDDACLMQDRDEFCKEANFDPSKAIFIPNYVAGLDFCKNNLVDYVALFIADSALATAKLLIETVRDAPEVIRILEKEKKKELPLPIVNSELIDRPTCSNSNCIKFSQPVPGKFCVECGKEPSRPQKINSGQATCQNDVCENFGKPVSGKFCSECGQLPKLPLTLHCKITGCPNFGQVVTSKFCSECGKCPEPQSSTKILKCQGTGCVNFNKPITGKFCDECGQPPGYF